MCDHIDCHGGKMIVRRVECTVIEDGGVLGLSWYQWEASPGDWFPVYEGNSWQAAMDAAWEHIRKDA